MEKHGFQTNVDNFDEDLQKFSLVKSLGSCITTPEAHCPGFLSTKPLKFKSIEVELQSLVQAYKKSITKNQLVKDRSKYKQSQCE